MYRLTNLGKDVSKERKKGIFIGVRLQRVRSSQLRALSFGLSHPHHYPCRASSSSRLVLSINEWLIHCILVREDPGLVYVPSQEQEGIHCSKTHHASKLRVEDHRLQMLGIWNQL